MVSHTKKVILFTVCRISAALILFSVFLTGQTLNEETNWFKEIGRGDDYYSRFDFTKYSRHDIATAKAKYLRIASDRSDDPWAGSYSTGTMLGSAEIIWSGQHGFVYHYVYHTLASIDFGLVVERGDSVWFESERAYPNKRKRFFETEFIKVKFGERHLLVPKSRLSEFAILAAGLEVPRGRRAKEIELEESFFWTKVDDEDKRIADVPTYPARYVDLVRRPIRATVSSVGKLNIKKETSPELGTTSQENLRTLSISAGRKQGVRVGMRFYIDDLEEWIEVTSVSQNDARVLLSRPFIDGEEYCDRYRDGSQIQFKCRDPKIGMETRTTPVYF